MRLLQILIIAVSVIVISANAMGEAIWCSSSGPGTIFCHDFDRNCVDQPPYPEACPNDVQRSDSRLRAVWQRNSWNYNTAKWCGSNMCGEEILRILPTDPYGGRHANGGDESGTLGQNTADLTSYIQSAIPGHTLVTGSDDEPLVLTFAMGCLAHGLYFSNGYMELSLGDPSQHSSVTDPAKAPTDYVLVGADDGAGCFSCDAMCDQEGETSGAYNSWPTICQQEFPHSLCPPKQTFVRNALAIGALAFLDSNPCHCCTALPLDPERPLYSQQCTEDARTPDFPKGWQEPTNVHLSYYDGLEWRVLKEGMGGPGSYGDFRYGNYILWDKDGNTNADEGHELVVLTIKTNTVDIYHKTTMVDWVEDQWVETVVESVAYDLPRHYTGDFNRLRVGTDESCRLLNTSYTCDSSWKNGQKLCKVMKEERCDGGNQRYLAKYVAFDNVKLSGGTFNVQPGACCLPNGECVEIVETDCDALDGLFAGPGTTCEFTQCCPYPFADGDFDGDVDQADFGEWQVCFSGTDHAYGADCDCYDRNNATGAQSGDGDVDGDDFAWFVNCFTGPSIMLDTENPPVGCIP